MVKTTCFRTVRIAAIACASACGEGGGENMPPPANDDAGTMMMKDPPALYAVEVHSFTPGADAGHGQNKMPGVVLGPPGPAVGNSSALDVVSLGARGSIVVGFGTRRITDGPGADFIVFENAFYVGGDTTMPFYELGEVSVSTDAMSWHTFACNTAGDGQGRWPGCAGWKPVEAFDGYTLNPLDPSVTGGDAFDLAEVGVGEARYVRIVDLASVDNGAPTEGFDLDAVGAIHLAP